MLESKALEIVPAKSDDIDTVLEILDQATSWLLKKGITTVWVPGGFSRENFLDQISKGEVYLGMVAECPVGTFILQWSDPFFWGEQPPVAGYVHKLAVRPEYSGQGIGLAMLGWAENRARLAGKTLLRLNCMADDRKIRDYYERAGFAHRGDVVKPKATASLYEKTLERTAGSLGAFDDVLRD